MKINKISFKLKRKFPLKNCQYFYMMEVQQLFLLSLSPPPPLPPPTPDRSSRGAQDTVSVDESEDSTPDVAVLFKPATIVHNLHSARPELLVSRSRQPPIPSAGSARILGAPRPGSSQLDSLAEPTLISEALHTAHNLVLGLGANEEFPYPSQGPPPLSAQALDSGSFLPAKGRKASSSLPTDFKSLPSGPVPVSSDDKALNSRQKEIPRSWPVPLSFFSNSKELARRALVEAAIGEQINSGLASLSCSREDHNVSLRHCAELDLQAPRSLLFALSEVFSRLAASLSVIVMNLILVRRDVLLSLSSLNKDSRRALRTVPYSPHSLFGGCVRPALVAAREDRQTAIVLNASNARPQQPPAARPPPQTPPKRPSGSRPPQSRPPKTPRSDKGKGGSRKPGHPSPRGDKGRGRKPAPQ